MCPIHADHIISYFETGQNEMFNPAKLKIPQLENGYVGFEIKCT